MRQFSVPILNDLLERGEDLWKATSKKMFSKIKETIKEKMKEDYNIPKNGKVRRKK